MAFPLKSQHILQILAHLNFPELREILERRMVALILFLQEMRAVSIFSARFNSLLDQYQKRA